MWMMNQEQKANLSKLRAFLSKNRDVVKLDMATYCEIVGDDEIGDDSEELSSREMAECGFHLKGVECGASMCMLGWAATVFPERLDVPLDNLPTFPELGRDLFGVSDGYSAHDTEVGNFLFNADWSQLEDTNTVEHALYRIDKVLSAETEEHYLEIEEEWHEHLDNVSAEAEG